MTTHRHGLPMVTKFCAVKVPVLPGLSFFIDGNSKITAGNGTFAVPTPNALSLPAASVSGLEHCPGSTEACRASCYVKGLQAHAPDLYAHYQENERTLSAVLNAGNADHFDRAVLALGNWIEANCKGGFRWHVSGDVQSVAHAQFIRDVAMYAGSVQHWIYTRTMSAVSDLVGVRNLAVNLSADTDNYVEVRSAYEHYKSYGYAIRICYMSTQGEVPADLPNGSVVFVDYPLRKNDAWRASIEQRIWQMVCPTDYFGQSEAHRCGPCRKCM